MIRSTLDFKTRDDGLTYEIRTGRRARFLRGAWRCVVRGSEDLLVHPLGSTRWVEFDLRHGSGCVRVSGRELHGSYEATKDVVDLTRVMFLPRQRLEIRGHGGRVIILRRATVHAERVEVQWY